jgi:hypothetical protein
MDSQRSGGMKVTFKNTKLNKDNIRQEWDTFYKQMNDDVTAYYVEQARANAPTLHGRNELAEKTFAKTIGGGKYLIVCEHPAAMQIHEQTGNYHPRPKEQQSDTGGLGAKFIERAIYMSASRVKKHYEASIKRFFEGKPYIRLASGDITNYLVASEV